jgi:carbonic anhydrase
LHETELLRISDEKQRLRRMVELNVMEQVRNLAKTNIIQNALRGDKPPRLHGLVYDIADGVLKDLNVDGHEVIEQMEHIYRTEAASSDDDANSYEGPQHDPANLAKDH